MALVLAGCCLGATPDSAGAALPGKATRIAFASNRATTANPTGDFDIFAMNGDGTAVTKLADNTAFDGEPAWSPDGRRIAFVSFRDSIGEVYTMGTSAPHRAD